jgi:acetyl-CoA carboxylase biotin carboxyl carrier protein
MASFTVPSPKASSTYFAPAGSNAHQVHQQSQNQLSFQLLPNPSHRPSLAFSGFQCPTRKQSAVRKLQAQLNEVTAEKSSNSVPATKSGAGSSETKVQPVEKLSGQNKVPDASSVSAFMTRVSDLVKLVDSRDIVELQLKQLDCEVIIRKKEALQQPTPPQNPHANLPSPPLPVPAPTPAPPSPSPSISQPALPAKTSSSSHPPFKCPMAGTFYRSPQPGEPPFVKVGDKVKQGQVVCIIEAMKLLNDIEADQSGTVTEILAEDGKPVSVDTPLFVIVP